ncbi:hypothetical protein SNOG_01540 [Parastagonospora nodorum SN15]|uniref:Uncharacterized protein n=1 Tax=Phaeosphaeria nodorum (strain SN15 / ATCC MYA-4574 / FGSC 10173) TaxID=321614 RepID=Q0V374_PHANO|nr:hypothetical protein SNOG_01540 [Parastagonospora nodorum SN15]EAT91189.1 hypothetical protein SNOG_01540 [Parastagonospora nodorum SN15]
MAHQPRRYDCRMLASKVYWNLRYCKPALVVVASLFSQAPFLTGKQPVVFGRTKAIARTL